VQGRCITESIKLDTMACYEHHAVVARFEPLLHLLRQAVASSGLDFTGRRCLRPELAHLRHSGSRFSLCASLPRQTALDFQIESKAQESSDKDNASKDTDALKCR
jgi:hypothetical protein